MRFLWCGVLLAVTGTIPLAGQTPAARADSAWAAGDRNLARRLYAQVLSIDPKNSHATFRAAELATDPADALNGFRRYTILEPSDPWGWMALGDRLSRSGGTGEALRMYQRAEALAPGERDVVIGRTRVLSRGGHRDRVTAEYDRWLTSHPDDAEAWVEAGRAWLRAGKPARAERALARAEALGRPDRGDSRRLARALRAPAIEPISDYQRDSDGNRTLRLGLLADFAVGDGSRLGLVARQSRIGDGTATYSLQDGSLRLGLAPRATTQLTLSGGGARLDPGPDGMPWTTPIGAARFRWRAPGGGAGVDLRAERIPLGTTPMLVANHAVRSEARAMFELPLGPFRMRTGGRAGSIVTSGSSTTRWAADAVVAIPIGWQAEISTQYHRMHYARTASAGYFAPDRVETVEGGAYVDVEGGKATFAFELGAGAQRIQPQAAVVGPWRLALRGWGEVTIPFGPGRALRLELEGYDAPFAPDAVATSATWRYLSLSAGVRWAVY